MQLPDTRTLRNVDAERCVLGALINYEPTRKHIADLDPNDFTDMLRRQIFVAIRDMAAEHRPIDIVTLDKTLDGAGGATNEAIECMQASPTGALVQAHIQLIRDAAQRRNLIEVGYRLVSEASDGTNDTAAVIDTARQALRGAMVEHGEWMDMRTVVHKTYNWTERRAKGEDRPIQSGLAELDRLIGGFFPGELTVIGARPGAGKSQMGMNIALAGAKTGRKIGFASLEMVDVQYGQRVFSREADVNGMRIRNAQVNDDEWQRIVDAMPYMAALPISFLFESCYIEDIVSAVQRKADADEIDMLVVDYLQLVRSRKRFEADRLRVAHISHTLKDITRDLRIPVIALAQVGRNAQGDMPTMADLRDSGDIEQDADNIMFLHKPTESDSKWVHPSDRQYFDGVLASGNEYVAVKVEKQRQGQTGVVCVLSDPSRMRYTCIDRRGEGAKG